MRLLPGAMNYVALYFPQTTFFQRLQLCTCSLLHLCLKRRSNRDSEGDHVQTRRGGEIKKSGTVYKAGREISASRPGGNQLWASSENIQGSLTHIPEGRAD